MISIEVALVALMVAFGTGFLTCNRIWKRRLEEVPWITVARFGGLPGEQIPPPPPCQVQRRGVKFPGVPVANPVNLSSACPNGGDCHTPRACFNRGHCGSYALPIGWPGVPPIPPARDD